jgi:uncharacterized protein (TIGR00290 family)
MKQKTLVFWSSGKDSAWTLHVLRQNPAIEVVALVATLDEAADRIAMHGVRRELVETQAQAAGLPLWLVGLPWPCANQEYEQKLLEVVDRARSQGITHFAFGDLFLEDIRAYRLRQFAGTGMEPIFPLWTTPARTSQLAQEMLKEGLRARVTCVDGRQLGADFLGREFTQDFLADLPATVDPCGERGEFHTFCHAGPMFNQAIAIEAGHRTERDGFHYVDLQRKIC